MTPDYKLINADTGKDLTATLKPFVMSIALTESVDNTTDTLSLSLNGEGVNQFPVSGTNLQVHLGYQETGLANMGVYKVDTKILSGMPLALAIKAGASDFNAPYKEQKNRHWDHKTLGNILKVIAQDNGLELVTDMADEPVTYLEQFNESDMALVTRLAKEYAAFGTIKAGRLVFKSAKVEKVSILKLSDLLNFRLQWQDKPNFDATAAHWHDRNSNVSNIEVWDGQSWQHQLQGKTYTLKTIYTSQWQACKAAKAKWTQLKQMTLTAQLTLTGRTDLVSKMGIKLNGIISGLKTTTLNIQKITHTLNHNGYKISIDCRA